MLGAVPGKGVRGAGPAAPAADGQHLADRDLDDPLEPSVLEGAYESDDQQPGEGDHRDALERGRIVEQGSPAQLLREDEGRYAALHDAWDASLA
jgi:hypothetical protein